MDYPYILCIYSWLFLVTQPRKAPIRASFLNSLFFHFFLNFLNFEVPCERSRSNHFLSSNSLILFFGSCIRISRTWPCPTLLFWFRSHSSSIALRQRKPHTTSWTTCGSWLVWCCSLLRGNKQANYVEHLYFIDHLPGYWWILNNFCCAVWITGKPYSYTLV